MADVLAIEDALELALKNRWKKIIFFSDSKIIFDSVSIFFPVGTICSTLENQRKESPSENSMIYGHWKKF